MKSVGIIPLYDDEKESYWLIPGYMRMLERLGAAPLMLPLTADTKILDYFLERCDGFLLTGGHDVAPEIYGEKPTSQCGAPCPLRDRMELYIAKNAVALDIPVFGICRGIQFLNACFGGTLYQDLPSEHKSGIEHHMTPPYNRVAHTVHIHRGTPLFDWVGKEELGVNSYHHQAIRTLSPRFAKMAVSPDGLTEAIYMPDKKYVAAVQWHPEFSYETDEDSAAIVQSFVEAL